MSGTPQDASRRDFQNLADSRRDVYAFLSDAFIEPASLESVEKLRQPDFVQDPYGLFNAAAFAPLKQMADEATTVEDLHSQLHQEFMNLFNVPGGQYVTPYESVFCDEREIAGQPVKGLLMGPSALDVKRLYHLAAIEIPDEYGEFPDHVGMELHFLFRLCAREREYIEAGDDEKLTQAWESEREFLRAHPARWLGDLRDQIHLKSKLPYYPTIVDMAVEFTQRDLATLEGLLGKSAAKPASESVNGRL